MKKLKETALYLYDMLKANGIEFNATVGKAFVKKQPDSGKFKELWMKYDSDQICARYKWKKLPSGLTSYLLERMLYTKGQLCGFKEDETIYILPFTYTGGLNCYGVSSKLRPIPYSQTDEHAKSEKYKIHPINYNFDITSDNDAILLFDSIPYMSTAVSRLYLNEIVIDEIVNCMVKIWNNLVISNKKYVIKCDNEKQADVIRAELIEAFNNENPFVVVTSEGLNTDTLGATTDFNMIELFNAMRNYDSLRCMMSGIDTKTYGENKGARLNSAELVGQEVQVDYIYDYGLKLRKDFAERMNEIFGTNIEVETFRNEEPNTTQNAIQEGILRNESDNQ